MGNQIFNDSHLLLDIDVKNQKEAFVAIANLAASLKITNDPKGLVQDLIKREEVSTTGMSDAVAIPHAMSADFNAPAIIVARFKNAIDWKAIGGQPVKVAFALLIPEKERSSLHMQYLQNIATALLDKEFNNIILTSNDKNKIIATISEAIESKKESDQVKTDTNTKGLIVGVSACATGVAHTYMAREALEKSASEIGYDIWIETQGQTGQEHKLTDEMIKKADYVVVAADINVELNRFVNKKIYITNTNEAINTPIQTLEKTIKSSKIYEEESFSNANSFGDMGGTKKGFMKHFLNGVSHMIPFIVFSGIMYAIVHLVTIAVHGDNWNPNDHPGDPQAIAMIIVDIGFDTFLGIMGGYIAVSIAGRAAFAPGFIATAVASNPLTYLTYGVKWMDGANTGISDYANPGNNIIVSGISLGIIATLMMGFGAGALVNAISRIKFHKYLKPIVPIIIIPVLVTSLLVFPFMFGMSGILGALMNWIGAGLAIIGEYDVGRIFVGLTFGAMVGFDMGGPVNKIAVATATTLIQVDPSLMGAVSAAIPVAAFGCALASIVIGRKLFTQEEKGLGVTAWFLGFIGISEAAIPFAAKRLKITIIANTIGSMTAGLLSCLFFVGAHVGMWGGLIIMFAAGVYSDGGGIHRHIPVPFGYEGGGASWQNILISCMWYLLAIASGTVLHAFLYVALIKSTSGSFFKTIFSKFQRKSKGSIITDSNKKEMKYHNEVIKTNWYYRYKINNERKLFTW